MSKQMKMSGKDKSLPNGLRILTEKTPSKEAVAGRLVELSRISTPSERKIVENAQKINGRRPD